MLTDNLTETDGPNPVTAQPLIDTTQINSTSSVVTLEPFSAPVLLGNDWTIIGRLPQPRLSGEVMENQQPTPPTRTSQSNETSRSRGAGRRTNRQKPHEKFQANKRIFAEIFSAKQFKKYFLIKSKSGNNLAEINVIKANKELTNHLRGKPSK